MKSQFDELARYLTEKRQATHFVFTDEHTKWLGDMDPTKLTEAEQRNYYNQFNASRERDFGRADARTVFGSSTRR